MNRATLAAGLARSGLPAGEVSAKAAMFELALSHADPRGGEPLWAWWVPGRLEVFGKHTDYAGGRTLVSAVPRGFVVMGRPRSDGLIRVVDVRRRQDVSLTVAFSPMPPAAYTGWRHYVEVAAGRLARNFPAAPLGADITLASDLPSAAGMSSSSALLVAIATALVRVGGLERRPEWRANIGGTRDAAGYFACIENGSSFGTLAGDAGVGTHGGSEDHAAILTAVPGQLSAFAFVPMRPLGVYAVPEHWRFVLAPCGIRAQKTGAAREAYNRLSAGTRTLLELWNAAAAQPAPSLAAALGTESGNIERAEATMRALVSRSQIPDWPPDALARRLDHFIREDGRIPAAVEAFRTADADRVGALADASQADADTLLGNQIPQTIALARAARRLGALASSSFGAGFGGSVWALVDRDRADAFSREWHPEAFVAVPGPGVVEIALDW